MSRAQPYRMLSLALLALALLYALWFRGDAQYLGALVVFALPPALFAIGTLRGSARAAFWSGVCGLLWFSHGVMLAYDRPAERGYALVAVALSLVVVFGASLPGLRARFARPRTPDAAPRGDADGER